MRTIIIYFSLTGKTKKLAVNIYRILKEKKFDVSLFEMEEKKKESNFFKNCIRAISGKSGEIEKIPNLENYDLIFIGTPVWAGRITPYVKNFLEFVELKNKKIFLFTTYGSGFLKNRAMREFVERVEMKGGKVIGRIEIKGKKVEENIDFVKQEIEKCLKEF
ncbi:MAG: flavodoxin domain-containing protein [Candidatus Omnitrophica bacterium]|nr:flavodoxin domain-containing protein [Candidatus Omnitrophota bacterium]MCM8803257.1 flavodoxin domain-containing protein [Candidatus Omnitrophota bacterium]